MAQVAAIDAAGQAAGQVGSTIAVNLLDKLFPDPQKVALSKAQTAQVIQQTADDKAKVDIANNAEKDNAKEKEDELNAQKEEADAQEQGKEKNEAAQNAQKAIDDGSKNAINEAQSGENIKVQDENENEKLKREQAKDADADAKRTKAAAKDSDNASNDFVIKSNFLSNAGSAILDMTFSQFNILIVCNNENDVWVSGPDGKLAPMDLIDVKLTDGETIKFQVYVFDSGEYIRTSTNSQTDPAMKGDSIYFWPTEAKQAWADKDSSGNPAGFHFKFTEKKKLSVKGLQSLKEAQKKFGGKKNGVKTDVTKGIGATGAEDSDDESDDDDKKSKAGSGDEDEEEGSGEEEEEGSGEEEGSEKEEESGDEEEAGSGEEEEEGSGEEEEASGDEEASGKEEASGDEEDAGSGDEEEEASGDEEDDKKAGKGKPAGKPAGKAGGKK